MTLALMIAVPFATALLLAILGSRIGRTASAIAGAGSLVIALGAAAAVGQAFAAGKTSLVAELGPWLPIRGATVAFAVDVRTVPLVLATLAIAAAVGLHAAVALRRDPRAVSVFIALDLLAASLVIVAAARDLLLLIAGWQGVGVSVYLLIPREPHRPDVALGAARAFVIARAGDAALLVAALAAFSLFQTVDLDQITARLAASGQARPDGLLAASSLIVLAALVRAAQVPFHSWLPDPSRSRAAAMAAMCGLATVAGAFLLIRLAALLDPGVMLAGAGAGVASAIIAMVAAIGGRRISHERWCTVGQLGLLIAASGLGSPSLGTLVVGTSVIRSAAPLLADRWPQLTRLVSAAAVAGAALIIGAEAPPAPFLAGIAVVALLAVADAALALAGDRSVVFGPLVRAGNAAGMLGRSLEAAFRVGAMALEQGGAQTLATSEASVIRAAARASAALDRLQRSSVWAHEALLLAAAAAIVAYWIVR